MPISIVTKFGDDGIVRGGQSQYRKISQIRGHNSEVSWTTRLVIELSRDIMPISIVIKFGDDWIRIVRIRERKCQYRQISPIKGP